MRSSKKAMSSGRSEALLDALVEEGHVVRALGEHGVHQVLDEVLGDLAVAHEVAEGHLRLDHPELGEVAAGVGVLGAEGRAERVDVGEGAAVGLDVELAGDGEVRFFAEEVLCEINGGTRHWALGTSGSSNT
jgi:hypothetical protein